MAQLILGYIDTGSYCLQRNINSKCLLCGEEDSIIHILVTCPVIKLYISAETSLLLELYSQVDLIPPDSPEEITSAILNGDRYLSCWGQIIQFSPKNTELINRAHNLASSICQKAHKSRDILMNDRIMNDMNATLPYDEIVMNDLEDTLPYDNEEVMEVTLPLENEEFTHCRDTQHGDKKLQYLVTPE